VLATRYGLRAWDMVVAGDFGSMAALHGDDIVSIPISDAVSVLKVVPQELYDQAQVFFG
jgi:ATP-dependent phosphofructokinase / diphosphate-dependent phosphofructokinase